MNRRSRCPPGPVIRLGIPPFPVFYLFGHSPFLYSLIPAHSAAQALLYVLLLQPQTGSYCMVQTQLGLDFSTHLVGLQENARVKKTRALSAGRMFFISQNGCELRFTIYDLRFTIVLISKNDRSLFNSDQDNRKSKIVNRKSKVFN